MNSTFDTALPHLGDKRVFGLDLLRAVAISLVVVCHIILLFPLREQVGEEKANLLGYLGVELFFVLSGFLIGQILIRDLSRSANFATLRRFLVRRWFRTLPNYFLFLAISYVGVGYLGLERGYGWKYLFFLQNVATPMTPFFTVSWSLAIEEWFYISFATLFFVAVATIRSFNTAMILSIVGYLLFFIALRFNYVLEENPSWDDGVRKIMIYRLDAIAVGVAAAALKFLSATRWMRWRFGALAIGILLFVIAVITFFKADLNTSVFARVHLFSLTSLAVALWLPALDSWRSARGVVADSITRLSLWSYSLYLAHGVLVDRLSIRRDILLQLDRTTMTVTILGFVAISLTVSALVYRFYERPMTALRERFED